MFLTGNFRFYTHTHPLQEDQRQGIIQEFTIPSPPDLIGFYSTEGESKALLSCGSTPQTHLGGCIMVTRTTVYQCRQKYNKSLWSNCYIRKEVSLKKTYRARGTYRTTPNFQGTIVYGFCGLARTPKIYLVKHFWCIRYSTKNCFRETPICDNNAPQKFSTIGYYVHV